MIEAWQQDGDDKLVGGHGQFYSSDLKSLKPMKWVTDGVNNGGIHSLMLTSFDYLLLLLHITGD